MFAKSKETQEADFEYFTIFDTKVGAYRQPTLAANKFDILRELETLFRDPANQKAQLFQNAEDFQLFSIGNFRKKTGTIMSWQPEHVANLQDIKSAVMRKVEVEEMHPRRQLDIDVNKLPGIEAT